MNDNSSRKSHAIAWTLSIIAIPLLYLLSVPPLYMTTARPYADSRRVPAWASWHGRSYVWLSDHPPLEEALTAYSEFWWDLTE